MIATLGVRPLEVRPPDLRRGLRASFWRNAVSRVPRSWTVIKRASDVLVGVMIPQLSEDTTVSSGVEYRTVRF